jgi:hypothetical protein
MALSLRKRVRERAANRCEYCRISQDDVPQIPFHVEHIIARKHFGANRLSNLCWSCHLCNLFKSSNLSGVDRQTGRIVRLFHPRRQKWHRHFAWNGPRLVGLTACGRATIACLCINLPHRIQLRRFLIAAGEFPP